MNRLGQKIIAYLLIICLILPSVTSALQSGPSMPEVQKFSPVDAKDLVNLYSGDFIYTLPVMKVPGPDGDYALTLSYKAGIQPEEEASWVGLGWNIQAGSVTRNVAEIPDDYRGGVVSYATPDYESYSVGVGVGIPNTPISVSAGVGWDTQSGLYGESGIGVKSEGGASLGLTMRSYFYSGGSSMKFNASFDLSNKGGGTEDQLESNGGSDAQPSFTVGVTNTGANPLISVGITIPIYFVNISMSTSFMSGLYNNIEFGYLYKDMYLDARKNFSLEWPDRWGGVLWPHAHLVGNSRGSYRLLPVAWDWLGQIAAVPLVGSLASHPALMEIDHILDEWPAVKYKNRNKDMYNFNWTSGFSELLDIFHTTKFATESGQTPELMNTNGAPYYPCWGMPNGNISVPSEWGNDACTESTLKSKRLPRLVFSRYNSAKGDDDAGVKYMTKLDQIYTNDFNTKDIYIVNAQGLGGEIVPYNKYYGPNAVPNAALNSTLHIWYPNYKFYDVIRDEYLNKIGSVDDMKLMKNFQFRFRGDPGGEIKQAYDNKLGVELAGQTGIGQGSNITGSKKIEFSVVNPTGDTYNPNTGLIDGFSITKEDGVKYEFNSPVFNNNLASFSQDNLIMMDQLPTLWSLASRTKTGTTEQMHPGLENECIDFKTYLIADIDPDFKKWIEDPQRTKEGIPKRVTTLTDYLKLGTHDFATRTFSKRWAYAWNLTGIKGTDYVDVNLNHRIDSDDVGFWVDFKYDNWTAPSTCTNGTSSYRWKSPMDGMSQPGVYQSGKFDQTEPEDYGSTKTRFIASTGSKTIQYLNHIKTATHIAFFETQDRLDAVGLDQSLNPDPTKKLKSLKRIVLLKLEDWHDLNSDGKVQVGEFSESDILQSTSMKYSYSLAKETPSSVAPTKGKLTLEAVQFGGKGGVELIPPYQFLYNNINPDYAPEKWDRWGMYKHDGKYGSHLETNAADVAAWSLSDIILPSGGMLSMDYESDKYSYVQNVQTKRQFDMNFSLEPKKLAGITIPGFEFNSAVVHSIEDRIDTKDSTVNITLLWKEGKLLGVKLPTIVPNPFRVGDVLDVSFNTIAEGHSGILDAIGSELENGWIFMESLVLDAACSWFGRAVSAVITALPGLIRCVLPELHWHCVNRVHVIFVGNVCVFGYPVVTWHASDCAHIIEPGLLCDVASQFLNPSKIRQLDIDRAAKSIAKLSRYRINTSTENVRVTTVRDQYVYFENGPDLGTDVMNKYRQYLPSSLVTYGISCFPNDVSNPGAGCTDRPVIKLKPGAFTRGPYDQTGPYDTDESLTEELLQLNKELSGVDLKQSLRDIQVCATDPQQDTDPMCVNADSAAVKNELSTQIGTQKFDVLQKVWDGIQGGTIAVGGHYPSSIPGDTSHDARDPITNMDDIIERAFSQSVTTDWPTVGTAGTVKRAWASLGEFGKAFSGGTAIESVFGLLKTSHSAIGLKLTGAAEERLGGGLRVKKITLDPGLGGTPVETEYEYGTGVATSEPPPYGHIFLDNRMLRQEDGGLGYLPGPAVGYETVKVKRSNGSFTEFEFLTPRTPENKVVVGGSASKNFAYSYLGQRIRETDKLEGGLATIPESEQWSSNDKLAATSPWSKVKYSNPALAYGSIIGRKSYSADNKLIETQKNNYKYGEDPVYAFTDGTTNKPLGPETERYYNAKTMLSTSTYWNPAGNSQKPYVWLTSYEYQQPKLIQVSTETTRDGVNQVTQNHRWDPLTGIPSLVSIENSNFKKWEYTVPYYLSNLTYSNNFKERNMLTESGKSYVYESSLSKNDMSNADLMDKEYLRSFKVNTWGTYEGIFRKRSSFAWDVPRNYAGVPMQSFTGFNENAIGPEYIQGDEMIKYDNFGVTEESKDQRGTYSNLVIGYHSLHQIAIINNARKKFSTVFTVDGSNTTETHLDAKNGWLRGEASTLSLSNPSVTISNISHTGILGVRVSNAVGPNNEIHGLSELKNALVISAWIRPVSGQFSISAKGVDAATHSVVETWSRNFQSSSLKANSWTRVQLKIPLNEIRSHGDLLDADEDYVQISIGTDLPGGGDIFVDDIRCAPADALIKSYTFNEQGNMTSVSDENDVPTYYEYDKVGRLINVRDYKGSVITGGSYDVK